MSENLQESSHLSRQVALRLGYRIRQKDDGYWGWIDPNGSEVGYQFNSTKESAEQDHPYPSFGVDLNAIWPVIVSANLTGKQPITADDWATPQQYAMWLCRIFLKEKPMVRENLTRIEADGNVQSTFKSCFVNNRLEMGIACFQEIGVCEYLLYHGYVLPARSGADGYRVYEFTDEGRRTLARLIESHSSQGQAMSEVYQGNGMSPNVRVPSITEYVWEKIPLELRLKGARPKLYYAGPLEGRAVHFQIDDDKLIVHKVVSRRTEEEFDVGRGVEVQLVKPGEFTTENLWQGEWKDGEFIPSHRVDELGRIYIDFDNLTP